jgi:predicted  nucleic acid-binding Zn-ribbon protein
MDLRQQPELASIIMLHKQIGELEKERDQLKRQVDPLRLELTLKNQQLAELEKTILAVLSHRAGESLVHLVRRLLEDRAVAEQQIGALQDARLKHDQQRLRWQRCVELLLTSLGELKLDSAERKMELAAVCADVLLRKEEERFARLQPDNEPER